MFENHELILFGYIARDREKFFKKSDQKKHY